MRAPAWLRFMGQRPRWVQSRPEVVVTFTIDDQAAPVLEQVAEETLVLGYQARIAAERAAGVAYVESLVDQLGQGYGIDPSVWRSQRVSAKRERRIADARARLLERQDPLHPEFIGRRP